MIFFPMCCDSSAERMRLQHLVELRQRVRHFAIPLRSVVINDDRHKAKTVLYLLLIKTPVPSHASHSTHSFSSESTVLPRQFDRTHCSSCTPFPRLKCRVQPSLFAHLVMNLLYHKQAELVCIAKPESLHDNVNRARLVRTSKLV